MNSCNISKCYKAIIILLIVGMIIIISYIISICKGVNKIQSDTLGMSIVDLCVTSFTIWSLSHFILYFILGYYFPNCGCIIISIGIIWEIIEESLGYVFPKINVKQQNGLVESVRWWKGSVFDIIVDILGFYLGKAAYLTFSKL